jgi:hypothetical protein
MPGARAPAAARVVVVSTRVSHHGYAETPGIPARNGFNGFLRALPGDRAFLSPSPRAVFCARLDAGVEASGPHDFAVRKPCAFVKAPLASTASHPASVTIAIRPSSGSIPLKIHNNIRYLDFLVSRQYLVQDDVWPCIAVQFLGRDG